MTARSWRLTVWLVTAALLGLVVFMGARVAERGEQLARDAAAGIVFRSVQAAAAVLNRHLLQVDSTLAGIGPLVGQVQDPAQPDPAHVSRLLQEVTSQSFVFRDLILVRPNGEVWSAAQPGTQRRPLPLPMSTLATPAAPGMAVIGGPVRNPLTGEEALYIARPTDIAGVGPGFAVAEVPVSLLATVLAPLENPVGLRLRLETTEGLVLAAGVTQSHLVGRRLPNPLPAQGTEGEVRQMPSRQGGGPVFMAALRGQYPGTVVVSALEETLALGSWQTTARNIGLVTAGLSAMVLALGATLAVAMRLRERSELERAAFRATLEAAIDALPNGFVMWDAEDRLVVCNRRYRDFYKVSEPFLVPGALFEDIIRKGAEIGQYPQMGEDLDAFVRDVVRWHHADEPPFERELPDGRWILVAETRVPDGGIVGIRTDITDIKRAMAELARTRDVAAAATAAKSRMVAHVSHEMRTPLSALLRMTDHMRKDAALSDRQRRRAEMVAATARHLLGLANEVLDLAAIEAGSLSLAEESVSPRRLAEEAVAIIAPIAEEKRVALVLDAEGLPQAIAADATRLRQVLVNLLGNAVKFGPADSRVTLSLRPNDSTLGIEVTDEGPGVAPADRERLFADFVRLSPLSAEGTGLGLAISARLVALMGGRIGVGDNPAGRGARFWVELPIRAPAAAAAAGPVRQSLRLLAVDDAPANLSVLRALLSATGCELETVTEAPAALEILEHAMRSGRPFDAVLMDVMMPGMDGLEATRRIRAMPGLGGRVPIIAVTAGAFPEDIAAAKEAGMDLHVTKPIEREKLLQALAAVVPHGERSAKADGELAELRPIFLEEVSLRLAALESDFSSPSQRAEAAHALVAAVGHLGLRELAEEARLVVRALRAGEADAAGRGAALAQRLRQALPELTAPAS